MRPIAYSPSVIHSGAAKRSQSMRARPTWSGWVCVHSTRTIGRPSSSSAITVSQWPRSSSVETPQPISVQPSRPRKVSRSSQRLMWFSAKGSGMRSQCTPGATPIWRPGSGSVSAKGSLSSCS